MIVGRNAERLAGVAEEITARGGGTVRSHPADVTDEEQVERPWRTPRAGMTGCTGCALRGRIADHRPGHQMDSEAWRRTVDLNVNGSMYVLKHAAREMVRGVVDPSSPFPPSRPATSTAGSVPTG